MRLGVALDLSSAEPVRPQVDRLVTMLAHAEQHGFDSVWVGESYHATPQPFHLPSVLMVLSHLAGRTTMALGTAVLLLRAYSPEKLAYEAALLDQLCEGRLTLGLGLGNPEVARRTGRPPTGPAGEAFDAALRLLREAWSSPGDSGDDHPVAIPAPAQPGGPTILVGGRVAASARRAATLADGLYGATNYTDDLLLRQAEAFRSYRDDGVVATTRFCVVHEDGDTARELAARYLKPATDYYTARNAWMGADGPAALELPMVGTPEEVRATLDQYAAAGVTSVQLRVAPVGTPADVAHHTLDLVGAHVLPRRQDTTTNHLEGDDDR